MPITFSNKPDPNKSLFSNYYDHLSFFYKSRNGTCIHYVLSDDDLTPRYFAVPHLLRPFVRPFGRFNVFSTLHDSYDYLDEVFGATLVPLALLGVAVYYSLKAFFNLLTLGIFSNKPFLEATLFNVLVAIFAICFASYCLSKSLISLLSCPLLTMVYGYNTSNEDRFCRGLNNPEDFEARKEGRTNSERYEYNFTAYRGLCDDPKPGAPSSPKELKENDEELKWHTQIRPRLGFGNV